MRLALIKSKLSIDKKRLLLYIYGPHQKGSTMTESNKLLIKIRGKTNNPIYRLYARLSAKKLGLQTHTLQVNPGELAITVEGKNESLWKMVEKCKHSKIYASVTQVSFEFIR